MNKSYDERFVPKGEYLDALNMRFNSSEGSSMFVAENARGNEEVAVPQPNNISLSSSARAIGAYGDTWTDKIYVFVVDPASSVTGGVMDLIYSFDPVSGAIDYHLISVGQGTGTTTTGFSSTDLISQVVVVENELYFLVQGKEPFVIDLKKRYTYSGATDDFTVKDIMVIKAPPLSAPAMEMVNVGGNDDWLEDRFITFAYRYRYANNKYSATSAFTPSAFLPETFRLSYETYLNEGMRNAFNAAKITVNTGDSQVIGIEILAKDSESNNPRIIEKIDKSENGYGDNDTIDLIYSSQQVVGILPDSELLRLYDNVPKEAFAMTVMGNRIMYGNYKTGYNMVDSNGNAFSSDFYTNLVSEAPDSTTITPTLSNLTYTIGPGFTGTDCNISIDFSGISLTQGSYVSITLRVSYDSYFGTAPYPSTNPSDITTSVDIYLSQSYNSVYEFASSDDFKRAIGDSSFVSAMVDSCSVDKMSLADSLNCNMPSVIESFNKVESGVDSLGDGIKITTSTGSDVIQLGLPAYKYSDGAISPQIIYVTMGVAVSEIVVQNSVNTRSLHSNWEYETGLVYMDDFGRSSHVLISDSNTVSVPPENSGKRNYIQAVIPSSMRPPAWATKYRFVFRPSHETYQTVFSQNFFKESGSNATWFLLDGENTSKVEEGQNLIVKADVDGPVNGFKRVKVLEKEVKAEDDIVTGNPAGLYIKVIANDISVEKDDNSSIIPGTRKSASDAYFDTSNDDWPFVAYPLFESDGGGGYQAIEIPAGSQIRIELDLVRNGRSDACGKKIQRYDKLFVAGADYTSVKDWFDAEAVSFDDMFAETDSSETENTNKYSSALLSSASAPSGSDLSPSAGQNKFQFYNDTSGGSVKQYLLVRSGTQACTGIFEKRDRRSTLEVRIDIVKSGDVVVFETEPQETVPEIYYENGQVFDIISGEHQSNNTNQVVGTTDGVVDLDFHNCYSFGNGVESYRVEDAISGKIMNPGERVRSTSLSEYREIDFGHYITWSGIFNDDNNVNNLNEFNPGLSNFKRLEETFGPVYVLYGRKTDILVIQEDKLSYVLSGKNLLSDAAAGGIISSIPEVLGTQIANTEEVGISNQESFASFGKTKFWVDAKRNLVLMLVGSTGQSEKLSVISDDGMMPYFRDLMISNANKQFLGEFDQYSMEYVLSTNDISIPGFIPEFNCGSSRKITIDSTANEVYDVEFGQSIGDVTVTYTVGPMVGTIKVDVDYNGSTFTSGNVSTSGSFTFSKSSVSEEVGRVTISSTAGPAVITVDVGCPQTTEISVRTIAITSGSDEGKSIHVGYGYESGSYNSPSTLDRVNFSEPSGPLHASSDKIRTGGQGEPAFPVNNSSINFFASKKPSDSFDFDPSTHKVFYIRTAADLTYSQILTTGTEVTPMAAGSTAGHYVGSIPSFGTGSNKLYILFDLRDKLTQSLTYSASSATNACCGTGGAIVNLYYLDGPSLRECTEIYSNPEMTTVANDGYYSDGSYSRQISGGELLPPEICAPCTVVTENVISYSVENNLGLESSNILSIDAKATVGGTDYINATATGSGTDNVPSGVATLEMTVDYDEAAGPIGTLYLIIESPTGTVIETNVISSPTPDAYTVTIDRTINSDTSVKFRIEKS